MITSSETHADNHTQADGRRYVRFRFVDHLGGSHWSGPMLLDGAADYDAIRLSAVPRVESDLDEQEQGEACSRLENGEDALVVVNSAQHSTMKKLAKKIIRYAMRNRDVHLLIALEPLITYLRATYTGAQIANFLDVDLPTLSRIAQRYDDLIAVRTVIDADAGRVEEIE